MGSVKKMLHEGEGQDCTSSPHSESITTLPGECKQVEFLSSKSVLHDLTVNSSYGFSCPQYLCHNKVSTRKELTVSANTNHTKH